MKRLVFAAVMLAASTAMADKVRSNGTDEIRLMEGPCVHGGVLGMLKPEWRPKFRKGQAMLGGKMFFACWIDIPEDSAFWVLFDDGDEKAYRMDYFKDDPGI